MPGGARCGAEFRLRPGRASPSLITDSRVGGSVRGLGVWLKRAAKAVALPTLFIGICGYFAWHAVHGERGTDAREERRERIAQARAERDRAIEERDAMERRVAGLRGPEIDRDQLEERARALLNLHGREEIVIPWGPDRRLY
jgi:cell division protein FtsB